MQDGKDSKQNVGKKAHHQCIKVRAGAELRKLLLIRIIDIFSVLVIHKTFYNT
jgi:hypothetical protein